MLLCKAVGCSWQDWEYLGSLSTEITAGKDHVDELRQWSGATEKMKQRGLHENNAEFSHPCSIALEFCLCFYEELCIHPTFSVHVDTVKSLTNGGVTLIT